MKRLFCYLILLMSFVVATSQTVMLNEIMQSNVNSLFVESDFPDSWVELYNNSNKSIDIDRWYIGPTSNLQDAYCLRCSSKIAPKSYLLVYCDKKDYALHTDFRLESGKGEIFLFDAHGVLVDKLFYPKMLAPDVAFGRREDGTDDWQFELKPTPNGSNWGGGSTLVSPDPTFSIAGKVMSDPQELSVTIPEGAPEHSLLYWTLDGSEPTLSSEHGECLRLKIDKTTIVKAKIISPIALARPSVTQSYIFHPREVSLPIISIATDSVYLYDEKIGILLGGLPLGTGNCYQNWRRPINIEMFLPDEQQAQFNQLAETAVGGVGSRIYSQKSLKLYANKRFGEKNFKGRLWPQDKPWIEKVKSMKLRNGGNRCVDTRFEDALGQRIFGRWVDTLEFQAYQPVIAYINGQYKGIYELRERSDEDFLKANYDIDDDVDICEHFVCDDPAYAAMMDVIQNPRSTYADFCALMEMDEFINYLCCEFYVANEDFPHNNVYMWKLREEGARWHFLLKDLDYFSPSSPGMNYMHWLMVEGSEGKWVLSPGQHALIQRLFGLPEFRERFLDKIGTMLGDFLHPDVTVPMIEAMRDEIAGEMEATFATFTEDVKYSDFEETIAKRLIPYCQSRPQRAYNQLSSYFDLGDIIPLSIERGDNPVSLNGVALTQPRFDGWAWAKRRLNLDSGNDEVGWNVTIDYGGGLKSEYSVSERKTSLSLTAMSRKCQSISFSTQARDCAIREVGIPCDVEESPAYWLNGMPASPKGAGLRVVRTTDGRYQKLFQTE